MRRLPPFLDPSTLWYGISQRRHCHTRHQYQLLPQPGHATYTSSYAYVYFTRGDIDMHLSRNHEVFTGTAICRDVTHVCETFQHRNRSSTATRSNSWHVFYTVRKHQDRNAMVDPYGGRVVVPSFGSSLLADVNLYLEDAVNICTPWCKCDDTLPMHFTWWIFTPA